MTGSPQNFKLDLPKQSCIDQKLTEAYEQIKSLQETVKSLTKAQATYKNAMKLIKNLRCNFEQHKTFIKFPDSGSISKHDF